VSRPQSPNDLPIVVVLLATLNGRAYLAEQIDTIMNQNDVVVELVVSDDGSNDGTWELLTELAAHDPRVTLLERAEPSGSPAANFYRLLRDADISRADAVAFADQDDLWLPGRLSVAAKMIGDGVADGVSSDVEAFDDLGHRFLVKKSYAQRRLDFLFESAGPGATMTMSTRLVTLIRDLLTRPGSVAAQMECHDWLAYSVCRSKQWNWIIRDEVTVKYRQHDNNALGANHGLEQGRHRLSLIRNGWHRHQAVALVHIAQEVDVQHLERWTSLSRWLESRQWRARWALALRASQLRRRPRERVVMAVLLLIGLW
jgi:rhamnosyltransferase